jgi:hypothetical protein
MRRWLWPVNTWLAAGLLVCTAMPVVTHQSRASDCPSCDPHGYAFIFSFLILIPIALLGLTVLSLMRARRKAGLVVGLLNAFLVGSFATGLSAGAPSWLLAIIGVLALSSLVCCVAGLVWAPARSRQDVSGSG